MKETSRVGIALCTLLSFKRLCDRDLGFAISFAHYSLYDFVRE